MTERNMKHFISHFETKDHLELFLQGWEPLQEPKYVFCFLHGLGDHSDRYFRLAKTICSTGSAFISFDRRGNGRSYGNRGHIPNFDLLMDDIERFRLEAVKRFGQDKKYIFYGHSFGGNLVLNYAIRRKPPIAAVIASSPAITVPFKFKLWQIVAGRLANIFWPSLTADTTNLDCHKLTRNPEVKKEYFLDLLVHNKVSGRTFCYALDKGKWLLEHAVELKIPTLTMHGTEDFLTNYRGTEEFAQKAGKICTLKIWQGYYHELHFDLGSEKVLDFLFKWVDKTVSI